ncbi:MAG: hypothetical protein ACOVQ0_18605 [Novosphingobium sp.]|uniref:hypothetical protein n=1 Tax=Novosphingobium sp. TaxID=1874826 RepID=UPI003B9D281E
MTDLSALSLQTALTPVAMPTVAAPLEKAGNPAELGAGSGTPTPPSFDALLALMTTTQAATSQAAGAILPESGKTLPEAAIAVAPLPLANLPQAALLKVNPARPTQPTDTATDVAADPLAEVVDENAVPSDGEAEVATQPDIALFTAIFAAPDRLAAPAAQTEPNSAASPQLPVATPASPATPAPGTAPATPATVAAAIASTAQIELAPTSRTTATPVTARVASPSAAEQAAPAAPAVAPATTLAATLQTADTAPATPNATPVTSDASIAPESSEVSPRKQAASAPEAAKLQLAEALTPSTVFTEAPVQADNQPVSGAARSETKAERIDFATLVDTLARAREEASPRTVNVAVTNTDFGRVSLRFDRNDNGMAVAMSSADPGFARAVSASADAAATSADTRNPNSQAQGDARAQASDTSTQRQQQSQHQQGQQQQARTDVRTGTGGTQASTLHEDATGKTRDSDSGIYA